jgi:16S rRNA (cytidine1402-2'-O)-methyltransferase
VATLKDVEAVLGARAVAAARELTKRFEEIVRGPAGEVRAHFERTPPRGEFVLVVAGSQHDGIGESGND